MAVAAYLALCLLDHAARADTGSLGQIAATDPVTAIKTTAAASQKAAPNPKSLIPKAPIPKATSSKATSSKATSSKVTAPETHPQRITRPAAKAHLTRAPAAKKIKTPKIQTGEVVRREQLRTSRLIQPKSEAVRGAVRASASPARAAVVRQKSAPSAQLSSRPDLTTLPRLTAVAGPAELPESAKLLELSALPGLAKLPEPAELPLLTALPELPQVELPAWPQLPSWPQVPSWPQLLAWPELLGLPQAGLPAWPQLLPRPQLPGLPQAALPAWPQLPSWSQLPGSSSTRAPAATRMTATSSAPGANQALIPPASAQVGPFPQASALGLSGVTKPPAAQAQPLTVPLPGPPRQPADRSTSTGQARDSGGSNAPAMGTVPSSWRPELTAAGRHLATDFIARGRTVRYAGPPS
ncbi:hypothetical protein [Actinoplanes sp. NPDC026619]|uniref:hypothetical protein n=1 Tax=Actinoplanes sp. NPDC026619 TaxID=3155798 RepID=UPI0033E77A47